MFEEMGGRVDVDGLAPFIGLLDHHLGRAFKRMVAQQRIEGRGYGTSSSALKALQREVREGLQAMNSSSAAAADVTLQFIDPVVILDHRRLVQAASMTRAGRVLRNAGTERFHWILGVGAHGHLVDYEVVEQFFEACGTFLASSTLLRYVSDDSVVQLPLGIEANPVMEEIQRIYHTLTQFYWVTRRIWDAAAFEIRSNASEFGALNVITAQSVQGLFDYLFLILVSPESPWGSVGWGSVPVDRSTQALLDELSIQASAKATLKFPDLFYHRDLQEFPFVQCNGFSVPVAGRHIITGSEKSLFALVGRLSSAAKGALFERVAVSSLMPQSWTGFEAMSQPITIGAIGSKNPGQVDFSLLSARGDCIVVGECKAYVVASSVETVVHSFVDQVKHAFGQLSSRIDAFKAGSDLKHGDGAVVYNPKLKVIGFAVVLHDYASAVWNKECLLEVGYLNPFMVAMPLHQAIVVIEAMGNVKNFVEYVAFRYEFLRRGMVTDEVDLLMLYLASKRSQVDRLAGTDDGAFLFMTPYTVDIDRVLHEPSPRRGGNWGRRLLSISTPL